MFNKEWRQWFSYIKNSKLIGIHIAGHKIGGFNIGLFLNYPITEFNNDLNLIKKYEDKDFSNLKLSLGYGDVYSALIH